MSGRLDASEDGQGQLNDVGHGGGHGGAAANALDGEVFKEDAEFALQDAILFEVQRALQPCVSLRCDKRHRPAEGQHSQLGCGLESA